MAEPSPLTALKHWAGVLFDRNPLSQTEREHAQLYNRIGDELKPMYGGKSGSITDRAKNYAGGWDYAQRAPEYAADRATLWQLADYLRGITSEDSRNDALADLKENLQGVDDSMKFVGPPDPYQQLKERALDWAKQNPRQNKAQGGLARMKECNCGR